MSQEDKINTNERIIGIELSDFEGSESFVLREYKIPRTRHGRRVWKLLRENNLDDRVIIYHLKEFEYSVRNRECEDRQYFAMHGNEERIYRALTENDMYQKELAKELKREQKRTAISSQSQKDPPPSPDEEEEEEDAFDEVDTWEVSSSETDTGEESKEK